eukprot:6986370-Pyramimonas_sp.AAC.1
MSLPAPAGSAWAAPPVDGEAAVGCCLIWASMAATCARAHRMGLGSGGFSRVEAQGRVLRGLLSSMVGDALQ